MCEKHLEYFRDKLQNWKEEIISNSKLTLENLQEKNSFPDDTDRASNETDRSIELRARDRQRKLISKIDKALKSIEDGEYGYCEETGDPIGLARLEARPTATLSVEAQERHERNEKYIGSNKPYSNGPKATIFYFALAVLSIFLGLAFFQYQTLFLVITILSALGIVFIFEQLFTDNSGTGKKNSTIDLEIDQESYQNQKIQSIGQLAGGVAHDFNNVLTAIIVSTDLLILRFKPEDPTFRELQEIRENAQRAAGIVRQLLAYSRQQNFNLEIISLTDLLQEQTILLNRLVGDKIKIDLKHDSKLWNIRADLNQFESVITNLVINARDAIEVNEKDGVITIQTDNILNVDIPRHYAVNLEDRDYVRVTVTDNGAGVPSEMKDKIFEPFYSSKGVQGTGLGLSMVYGIIKQLNGYIFLANSETGEGARFEIYIPRCIEVKVKETNETAIVNKKNTKDITGSGTILLVEDEDSVRTSENYKESIRVVRL